MPQTHTRYTDTATLIRALDTADATADAIALRQRSYQLLRATKPVHEARIVDVGCGTGRAVTELGPAAVGVDLDPAMLAAARDRFPGIDLREADATALPFGDGEMHGYRADKVYHMLPDPPAALVEARRVLAPGGRIVLIGQDWETMVADSDRPELTRRIVIARADTVPHPRIARAYRNMLIDAGFHDVGLEVRTMIFTGEAAQSLLVGPARIARDTGAISAEEADAWIGEQAARAAADRSMLAVPMFLASATR